MRLPSLSRRLRKALSLQRRREALAVALCSSLCLRGGGTLGSNPAGTHWLTSQYVGLSYSSPGMVLSIYLVLTKLLKAINSFSLS